jgi:hypothetical protein
MARTQIRPKLGVVTTTLGLAVLLAGPTATLGLGVPTVDSATTTVQGAVQTTEQTAATTVTQVETTVQSTVQTTTQQVAAPQPAAPAPAPATPTKTVTRVSAPVRKAATRVSRPSAPSRQAATTVTRARQQVSSTSGAVRTAAGKRTTAARTDTVATRAAAPRTQSRAGDGPSSQCDVSLLALLPGGNELGALIALACDAAGGLDLPARLGLAAHTDGASTPSGAGPSNTSPAGPTSLRARAAGRGTHRITGAGTPSAANAAAAAQPGAVVAGLHAAASGHAGALAFVDGVPVAHVSSVSRDASAAGDAGAHHHTWFSGQSRGTEILLALIFASLSLLAGITLWRLAVRWVIPRFA